MSEFIEVKAGKASLVKRKLVYNKGVNDAWYVTEPTVKGKKYRCKYYSRWAGIIQRCYSTAFHKKHPTYAKCSVCDEWLLFSNFKEWMQKQDWKDKHLDKDILIQGSRVYSPDACIFVTQSINNLLAGHRSDKGQYPVGVYLDKRWNRYVARIDIENKKKHLGLFITPNDAFEAYKIAKYAHIKEIASEQDEPLKSALLRWAIN